VVVIYQIRESVKEKKKDCCNMMMCGWDKMREEKVDETRECGEEMKKLGKDIMT
jgi:hypothetical protein